MECAKAGWRDGFIGGETGMNGGVDGGVKGVDIKLIGWLYECMRGEPWL